MTPAPFNLLSDGRIALEKLADGGSPPDPFAVGDDFWDDSYISEQLLDAHLDPDRDTASRSHDRIDAEIDWLVSTLSLEEGDTVLDLGCGPGLYCERLHDHGLTVTGVDLSRTALDHAKRQAKETDRAITYRHENYRDLTDDAVFDAVILVYFDFGTYDNEDRDTILRAIHDALVPGGRFAFDVYTTYHWSTSDIGTEWDIQEKAGFWRPSSYLVLSETIPYPDEAVYLDQHLVVDASGEVSTYRFWEQYYEPTYLTTLLTDHGYTIESMWEDFLGTAYTDESESIGVVTRRP